jgi:hypothetical protein
MTEREAFRRYFGSFCANDHNDDWEKYLRDHGVTIDKPEPPKEEDYTPEPPPAPKPEPAPRRYDVKAAARYHDTVNRCRDINARRAEARREETRIYNLAPNVRAARYLEGKKVADIAAQFNMRQGYVLSFAPMNVRQVQKAKKLRAEGATFAAIAEALNATEESVAQMFHTLTVGAITKREG